MKTALVTGGGSGIGRELCRLLYRDGYRLVVVSLVQSELDSLRDELAAQDAGGELITVAKDLSVLDSAADVYAEMKSRNIEVDVLVNNAGFGLWGAHLEQDDRRVRQMMLLNMVTLTELTTLFGRDMKQRGGGHILNIGSTTSFQPLPYLAAYAATKHYVVAFSEAIAEELADDGITVTVVCPGTTNTSFLSVAGVKPDENKGSVGSVAYQVAMSPEQVARVAYEGMMKGSRRPIPGWPNQLHLLAARALPNRVLTAGIHWFFRRGGLRG